MSIFTKSHRSAHGISARRAAEGVFNFVSSNWHHAAEAHLLCVDLPAECSVVNLALMNTGYRAFLLLQQKALSSFAAQVFHLHFPDSRNVRRRSLRNLWRG